MCFAIAPPNFHAPSFILQISSGCATTISTFIKHAFLSPFTDNTIRFIMRGSKYCERTVNAVFRRHLFL